MNLRPVSAKSAEKSSFDTSVCRAATGEMPVPNSGSLPIWAARIPLGRIWASLPLESATMERMTINN
jgi:hypothetical protein